MYFVEKERIKTFANESVSKFLSRNDADEGLKENLQIEKERPVLEVVKVGFKACEHLLEGCGVAVVQGGIGRHARAHLVEVLVAWVNGHNLIYKVFALRSRPYKCHVAYENIPQLGQLVEVVVAKKASDTREAVLILFDAELRLSLLGVDFHAAKFIDEKRPSAFSNALLAVDGRAAVLALDSYVAEEHQRREHHEAEERCEPVESAFYESRHTRPPTEQVELVVLILHLLFVSREQLFRMCVCGIQWKGKCANVLMRLFNVLMRFLNVLMERGNVLMC